jgi:hypothetical protein
MANETISQLPAAVAVSGANDLLELSQYTGAPGTGYTSKRVAVQLVADAFRNSIPVALEYIMTNSGDVLIGGVQSYVTVPFDCYISSASLICSPAGSMEIDVWRCTYDQFDGGVTHPLVGDSITGGNTIVLSSATKVESTLTSWTTTLYQGDILAFYTTPSPTAVLDATITLFLSRSI